MHFIYYDEQTQKKYLICVQTKYNSFFLCFFSILQLRQATNPQGHRIQWHRSKQY